MAVEESDKQLDAALDYFSKREEKERGLVLALFSVYCVSVGISLIGVVVIGRQLDAEKTHVLQLKQEVAAAENREAQCWKARTKNALVLSDCLASRRAEFGMCLPREKE